MPSSRPTNLNVFALPDLGEGLDEAELIEWCVRVGQHINEFDTLAKMETAKALVEIPSPRSGVISALHGKPGQAIKVGAPLVTYKDDEPATESAVPPKQRPQPSEPSASDGHRQDAGTVVGNLGEALEAGQEPGHIKAAPAVRRLARDLGVNLQQVAGTGIGGRITRADVEAAAPGAAVVPTAGANVPPPAVHARDGVSEHNGQEDLQRIPFRGIRRTIAERLHYSVTHAVHFTVMDEADVTALDVLRRKLVAASNEKISLLPFVASAAVRILTGGAGTRFNRLNSTVDDDRQNILQHRAVHLGIATDTEEGLMVPVIRDAERLGVLQMNRRIAQLAKAARDRTIPADQLAGSTFTISNFGSLAGRFATPIINYPEVGILAVGRAREDVVVRDGMIGVGKLLPLSLAADHRVIDGGTAAMALARIIQLLQSPEELLPPGREEV